MKGVSLFSHDSIVTPKGFSDTQTVWLLPVPLFWLSY